MINSENDWYLKEKPADHETLVFASLSVFITVYDSSPDNLANSNNLVLGQLIMI